MGIGLRGAAALAVCGVATTAAMASPPSTATGNPRGLPSSSATGTGFVSRRGTDFVVGGQPYRFAGTNCYYVTYQDTFMVDDVLTTAAARGFSVVRLWAFIDIGLADGSASVDHNGPIKNGVAFHYWDPVSKSPQYNDTALAHLDYVVHRAGQLGLRVLLSLTNNWQDFGGMDQYVSWRKAAADGGGGGGGFEGNHDDFYSDSVIIGWYKAWAAHLVERTNIYSQTVYREDPTIFGWELANEPRCQGSGNGFGTSKNCTINYAVYGKDPVAAKITAWVANVAGYIKSIDPNHMVGTGDEGFYCERYQTCPDATCDCYYGVDTMAFARVDAIDYMSLHLYPDTWGKSADWATDYIVNHSAMAHDVVGKPVVLGEFGAKGTQSSTYLKWTQAALSSGMNGDLFWMISGRSDVDAGGWVPDYDGFAVYCPNATQGPQPKGGDPQSCGVLQKHAADMASHAEPPKPPPSPAPPPPPPPPPGPPPPGPPLKGFVTTDGPRFMLDGKPFFFAGANSYDIFTIGSGSGRSLPQYMDAATIDAHFATLARNGVAVLRTWGFNSQSWHGFELEQGQYNEMQFREFDYIVASARNHGIRLIVTLDNYWTDYGGIAQRLKWAGASQRPNQGVFFSNEQATQSYLNYVKHFITRINTFTNVTYCNEAAIMAWELMNEPRHQGFDDDLPSTVLRAWVDRVGAFIKGLDPNHLISSGIEGHGESFGYGGDEGNNFTVIHSSKYIDFCSAHAYPTASWANLNTSGTVALLRAWTRDCQANLNKPMFLGEFNVDTQHGARTDWWKAIYGAIEQTDAAGSAFWWFEHRKVDEMYGIMDGDAELQVFQQHAANMRRKNERV